MKPRVAAFVLLFASGAWAEPPPQADAPPANEAPAPTPAKAATPSSGATSGARAEDAPRAEEVLLLRTAIVGTADSTAPSRPTSRDLAGSAQAQKLDLLLSDAIQDLGLTLDLSERREEPREFTDLELVARAAKSGRWIVYPSLDARGSESVLRLAAVAPGTKTVVVRTEVVKPADLAVRSVVMLRDVVTKRSPAPSEAATRRVDRAEPAPTLVAPTRSQGRATLAFNAALFGGFVGYSVQRATRSSDPRLLFPLMALGTGLGLGASAIVAEEWDIGIGDAWYLSAGAWWPAMSGLFLARSRTEVDPTTEYGYALVGAVSGIGLTTASLAIGGHMSEGGALLTHSGSVFGLLLGGMTQLAIEDKNGQLEAPHLGLGIGTAAGFLIAGTVARRVQIEPSRVLAIDLGAGLGGLAGAAAASPLIVRGLTQQGSERFFLLTTMGTTVAGGVVAWFLTRKSTPPPPATALSLPHVGIGPIAEPLPWLGSRVPVLGLNVSGPLP
ncbi:MAG: hypothetical protein ABW133_03510 [Polyangiaceae bacterium]